MAKQKNKFSNVVPISEKLTRLSKLIVLRSAEKTDRYNSEILKLEQEIDYFYWGIKN